MDGWQILTMALGSVLSVLSASALWVFQRARSNRDTNDRELEARLKHQEQLQAVAITETRFREIIKDELQCLELRLINEGRLAPIHRKGDHTQKGE